MDALLQFIYYNLLNYDIYDRIMTIPACASF